MDKNCDICNFLQKPKHQLMLTSSWSVGLDNNQAYFGRAYVSLREHKSSLSELDTKDWEEFQEIVRVLENIYEKAFGAKPLNWGCFMNHAYRNDPPNSHVHWHVFPRYKVAPVLDGIAYDDQLYGNFYDDNLENIVDDRVAEKIIEKLKAHIR